MIKGKDKDKDKYKRQKTNHKRKEDQSQPCQDLPCLFRQDNVESYRSRVGVLFQLMEKKGTRQKTKDKT